MKLNAIDWNTLTRPWAAKMIGAAHRQEQAKARAFDAGLIEEAEWWAAFLLWENLRVFAITGERPA